MRQAKDYTNSWGVVVEFPAGTYLNTDIWAMLTQAGFKKMRGTQHYVADKVTEAAKLAAFKAAQQFNSGAPEKKRKLYPPGYFKKKLNG